MKQRTWTAQADESPLQTQLFLGLASKVLAKPGSPAPGSFNAASAGGRAESSTIPGQARDRSTFWQVLYGVCSSLHRRALTACVLFQLD